MTKRTELNTWFMLLICCAATLSFYFYSGTPDRYDCEGRCHGWWTVHYDRLMNPLGQSNYWVKGEVLYNHGTAAGSAYYRHRKGGLAWRGQLISAIPFVPADGKQLIYDERGRLRNIQTWRNGKRSDTTIVYGRNGEVAGELIHTSGDPDSYISRQHFESGSVLEVRMVNNLPHGISRSWYASGMKEQESRFDNGILIDTLRIWYESGVLRHEAVYDQGKVAGVLRNWHETGQKSSEVPYLKGLKHGPEMHWYASGAVERRVQWKQGERIGSERYWNESGLLLEETPYELGRKHGTYRNFYDSGALKTEIEYRLGYKHGYQRSYYENGKLKGESAWSIDEKLPMQRHWDEDGKLVTK